jgi:hypothetical protein
MNSASLDPKSVPLVIGTMLREEGRTGVHTHTRQLRRLRSFLLGRHPGRAPACADSWKAGRR